MSRPRRLLRHGARIALVAMLLTTLAPFAAHGRVAQGFAGGDADICSASGAKMPAPADHGYAVCTHCDGCTGNAHEAGSLVPPLTRGIALRALPPAPLADAHSPPKSFDRIAPPPRAPPPTA